MVVSFLRRLLGFTSLGSYTSAERETAEVENMLQDNMKAFQEVDATRNATAHANNRLAQAAERVRNPFADLEDLTHLHRDITRG